MDEPFGALDEITRDRLNEELRRVWKETGVTIVFVTHSIHEAAFLGQRVLMLAANPGRVREIVPVDLPDDRTLAARETPEFVASPRTCAACSKPAEGRADDDPLDRDGSRRRARPRRSDGAEYEAAAARSAPWRRRAIPGRIGDPAARLWWRGRRVPA